MGLNSAQRLGLYSGQDFIMGNAWLWSPMNVCVSALSYCLNAAFTGTLCAGLPIPSTETHKASFDGLAVISLHPRA